MAVIRQANLLGQMRVDVPHLRAIESGVAADFDVLAGKMLTGRQPEILRGFTIPITNTIGNPASTLTLNVASGLLMHFGASSSGTIFTVSDTQPIEALNASNTNVVGSFTAGVTNFVGLDLSRPTDSTTTDLVQFLDANSLTEIPQTVPLAFTLKYRIIITTQNFTSATNIAPIAKVVTDINNNIVTITDARKMMFRLGSGGDNPSSVFTYPWGSRTENQITYQSPFSLVDPFAGEDKNITNLKQWMDAMMTSTWELRGGTTWYAPTNRDNVKITYGQPVLTQNQDNFYFPLINVTATNITRTLGNTVTVTSTAHPFVLGQVIDMTPGETNFPAGTKTIIAPVTANTFTYTETGLNVSNGSTQTYSSLMWRSLGVLFENSTILSNTIVDNNVTGIALPDQNCLYIDIVRELGATTTLTAIVANAKTLGTSTIPGRRYIIAWRNGSRVFLRDRNFEVGRILPVATPTIQGTVQLSAASNTPLTPFAISDGGGTITPAVGVIGLTINAAASGNNIALQATGTGTSTGGSFTGGNGLSGGIGVLGTGGTAGGIGVQGMGGATNGIGGFFQGFGAGNGIQALGGGSAAAITATGGAANPGIIGNGGSGSGQGVQGLGAGTGAGVTGTGGPTTGQGVIGTGGTLSGMGVRGIGGTPNGLGGSFQGTGTGTVFGQSAGIEAAGGPGATSFTVPAIRSFGYIDLSGGSNPASTQGFSNSLTLKNTVKAWGKITTDGAGGVTVQDGFNITSVSISTTQIIVNWATNFANTNYAPVGNSFSGGPQFYYVVLTPVGSMTFEIRSSTAPGTALNPQTTATTSLITVMGTQ